MLLPHRKCTAVLLYKFGRLGEVTAGCKHEREVRPITSHEGTDGQ